MPVKKQVPNVRLLERQSEILKAVADGYRPRSKEYKAIRIAALALVSAVLEHPDEFRAFDGRPTPNSEGI
jgi:hypothetical protein